MEIHWFVPDMYWLSIYYKDEIETSEGGMNGILCDILLFIFQLQLSQAEIAPSHKAVGHTDE